MVCAIMQHWNRQWQLLNDGFMAVLTYQFFLRLDPWLAGIPFASTHGVHFSNLSEFFNISNQYRQVGLREAHFWCRNTVMLDVWRDMFVMWMSHC